eukprot:153413_1
MGMYFWLVVVVAVVSCQDPGKTWLSYAKAVDPENRTNVIITRMEAYWIVGNIPKTLECYFTPWFDIETSDNSNELQPVNPCHNGQWELYNEYFQYNPIYNKNSEMHFVKPGDIIHGVITYNGDSKQSYKMHLTDLTDGWSVNTTIKVQQLENGKYKKYTYAYIVFEHQCSYCSDYPPENEIIFYNISIYYNNSKVIPKWTTGHVIDYCNNRAHILNESSIKITWQS